METNEKITRLRELMHTINSNYKQYKEDNLLESLLNKVVDSLDELYTYVFNNEDDVKKLYKRVIDTNNLYKKFFRDMATKTKIMVIANKTEDLYIRILESYVKFLSNNVTDTIGLLDGLTNLKELSKVYSGDYHEYFYDTSTKINETTNTLVDNFNKLIKDSSL